MTDVTSSWFLTIDGSRVRTVFDDFSYFVVDPGLDVLEPRFSGRNHQSVVDESMEVPIPTAGEDVQGVLTYDRFLVTITKERALRLRRVTSQTVPLHRNTI